MRFTFSHFYAEEKVEEGHNSLFLLEYNRAEQQERIVANYILNDEAYNQHYFAFENDIIVLMGKRQEFGLDFTY